MMKFSTVFFISILICNTLVSQNFFTPTVQDGDVWFGEALMPAKVDSVFELRGEREWYFESRVVEVDDTMLLGNAWLVRENADVRGLLHFGDTASTQILLQEKNAVVYLPFSYTEKVTEFALVESSTFKRWRCGEGVDITQFGNWSVGDGGEPTYRMVERWLFKTPCGHRSADIPEVSKNVLLFMPSYPLNALQNKLLRENCTDYIVFKNQKVSIIKDFKKTHCFLDLKETLAAEPIVGLVELVDSAYLKRHILGMKMKLKNRGFYHGTINGEVDAGFKEAIIKYQVEHQLPIGQFDKKTISHLIN